LNELLFGVIELIINKLKNINGFQILYHINK
jgi:hypothetical protein